MTKGYIINSSAQNQGNGTSPTPSLIDIRAGSLVGTGTANSNVTNAGHVHPGNPAQFGNSAQPGTLTLSGNYTQTSLGNLDIDLAGSPASNLYDHLKVGGNATLTGALNVSLINGFTPTVGSTYDILDYGTGSGGGTLSGQFAALNGMTNTFYYTISYNTPLQDVTLNITNGPAPVPGPDSLVVLGLGLAGVAVRLRRRHRVPA